MLVALTMDQHGRSEVMVKTEYVKTDDDSDCDDNEADDETDMLPLMENGVLFRNHGWWNTRAPEQQSQQHGATEQGMAEQVRPENSPLKKQKVGENMERTDIQQGSSPGQASSTHSPDAGGPSLGNVSSASGSQAKQNVFRRSKSSCSLENEEAKPKCQPSALQPTARQRYKKGLPQEIIYIDDSD